MKKNYFFKKLAMMLFFLLFIGYNAIACTYTISLSDDYGDGWNGGNVTVSINGTAVLSNITLATGAGPLDYTFIVNSGDNISVSYTPGSWS